MTEEIPFRVAVVVIVTLTMAVVLPHRLRAASSGERISHQAEGFAFAIALRLMGLSLWVPLFSYLIHPPSVKWAQLPLADWLRWIGAAIGMTAVLLMFWTLRSLGHNLTDTVVVRSNATLTTHGPYRWIRHPFYVTTALLMASMALLMANVLIGLSSVAVLTMLAVRTSKEEQMLIERFGQEYRDYMQRTGRFWPRW